MKQMMGQRLRMKTWTKKLTAVWLAALIVVFSFNYDSTVQASDASAAPQLQSFMFGEFEIIVKPEGIIGNLNGLKLNQNEMKKVTSKNAIAQGKYCLDITGNTIYMPQLATGDVLSLVMKDGKEYSYSFTQNGSRGTFTLQTGKQNPVTPKPQPGTPDDPGSSDPGTSEHGITDANAPKLTNSEDSSFGNAVLQLEPKDTAAKITDVFFDSIKQEKKDSKYQVFNGGYYIDLAAGQIIFHEPTNDRLITIELNNGKKYTYKYVRDMKADTELALQADDSSTLKKFLKIRLVGHFEGAIQGQLKYDAISGASTQVTANKNSDVQVQAAEVADPNAPVPNEAWKPLNQAKNLSGNRKNFKIDLSPDSGMVGVYNVYDSAITLSGTPNKTGIYPVTVTVQDAAGNNVISNSLNFKVFGTNEVLSDYLKLSADSMRHMKDGKYIWDMEPWVIPQFTHDGNNEVTVPPEIKAWYGSNTRGVYGRLGEGLEQDKPTKHTLIIPSGANLTMVNMIVNSSVKIVVKNGAKFSLKDTSIYGKVVVENGGTFSMNHEVQPGGEKKFIDGAMINGQLILEDGATLASSKIYSNANSLTDTRKAKLVETPVVVARGTVNIQGDVFIRGDDSATGHHDDGSLLRAQPALRVENGKINIPKGSTLGVYGGGRTATTSVAGDALQLNNSEIAGDGSLIAIGGSGTHGSGGDAVNGTGKITVSKALLFGGNVYGKSGEGQAYTTGVTVFKRTVGEAKNGRRLTLLTDSDQPLYWNDITGLPTHAESFFGSKQINPQGPDVEHNPPVPNPPSPLPPSVDKVKITFAPGVGGSGTMKAVEKTKNAEFELPASRFTPPEGKVFKAWSVNSDSKKPGEKIKVTAALTVTALWKDFKAKWIGEVAEWDEVDEAQYEVVLYKNDQPLQKDGAQLPGKVGVINQCDMSKLIQANGDGTYKFVVQPLSKDGQAIGYAISDTLKIANAGSEQPSPNPPAPPSAAEEFTITVDPAGGNWHGETNPKTFRVKKDDYITLPEAPTKDGYTFLYWRGSKYKPGAPYQVKGTHTFTAEWRQMPLPPAPNPPTPAGTDKETAGTYFDLLSLVEMPEQFCLLASDKQLTGSGIAGRNKVANTGSVPKSDRVPNTGEKTTEYPEALLAILLAALLLGTVLYRANNHQTACSERHRCK